MSPGPVFSRPGRSRVIHTPAGRHLVLVLAFLCGLLAPIAVAAPQRIVGYLPRYRSVRPAQFETLTHVIVFSVLPDQANGTFKVFSHDPATGETVFEAPTGAAGLSSLMIDQVVADAAGYGVKVGLCIGGGGVFEPFQYLVINGQVDTFANHVRDFAMAHDLDEINIDWEKPKNQWDPGRAETIFAALSQRLQPHGIELTAAWTASTSASYALDAARRCRPYTDAVYVMSYAPTLASFQQRFDLYTKPENQGGQGYPPEEVCTGLQFFGRDDARTLTKTYSQLVDLAGGDINPALDSMIVEGRNLKFTGQDTLDSICDYSRQVDGGVMIWEIGQDTEPSHADALLGVMLDQLATTANTGTPHWWLRRHGITDDFEQAVLEDPDHDGQPTWQEYVSDTDPGDPLSRLELSPLPDAIRFATRPERFYTVFVSPDMGTGTWTALDGYPVAGDGNPVTVPHDPGMSSCFYRLKVSLDDPPPDPSG